MISFIHLFFFSILIFSSHSFQCPSTGIFPDLSHCDKFYLCSQGGTSLIATQMSCPTPLKYDRNLKTCLDGDCVSTTQHFNYPLCPSLFSYMHNPYDCASWIVCNYGEPTEPQMCASGMYFDFQVLACLVKIKETFTECQTAMCTINPNKAYTFGMIDAEASCKLSEINKAKIRTSDPTGKSFIFCDGVTPRVFYCCSGNIFVVGSLGYCTGVASPPNPPGDETNPPIEPPPILP